VARVAFIAGFVCALASACGGDDATEAPSGDPGPGPADAQKPPEGDPPRAQVSVGHDREMRGAWVATVNNSTWPSKPGLTPAASQAELVGIFDALASAHMNAVFLHVRPHADAFYPSTLEPWSKYLTGTQGVDPGWDPLAFAVTEAHKRRLELHAWINPYRGLVEALAADAVQYGGQPWMNPASKAVQQHIYDVLKDILTRYDVDGVHLDDFFYPYPISGETFDDSASYTAYTNGGGTLSLGDWRRDNVNTLIHGISDLVAKTKPEARFGVSPFGIYRPGTPPGITGLDAYADIYCDAPHWMKEGWVDYLAPQLYWPTTKTAQAYEKLLDWWATLPENGQSIFIGHDATSIGLATWPLSEYDTQMQLLRGQRSNGVRGSIFWSATPVVADKDGLRTMLATEYYGLPAATPPLKVAPTDVLAVPTIAGSTTAMPPSGTRFVAVYKDGAIVDLLPAASPTPLSLTKGTYAISAIDRFGRESAGVVVDVP